MRLILAATFLSFLFWGCENEIDNTPPKPPQGIRTVSLDNSVEISWLPSQADDVEGYNIWVSDHYDGKYQLIGTTSGLVFVDNGAVNGVTYFYAVSAYDFSDNESVLSKDVVYDTPRPEGFGVSINDIATNANSSGYSFGQYDVVNFNLADFYYVVSGNLWLLEVWNDTEIQDMGYTSTLDEISSSPTQGWAYSGTAEVIEGHTYVFKMTRTGGTYYAKIRVVSATSQVLTFDWAFQTTPGNVELKIATQPAANRKLHTGAGLVVGK